MIDSLRETFELHGFASIETRVVEPLDQLLRKGEIDKEVYVLRRLQADGRSDPSDAGSRPALRPHRAVRPLRAGARRASSSSRSGATRSRRRWRGERPQEGRYREFTQADIDVVGRDDAARFHSDVEVAEVMAEALSRLPLPPLTPARQQPQADRGLLPRSRARRDPAAT